jgi:hypothetical protein
MINLFLDKAYVMRERGVTLAGPAPQTLIDPIQPNDLRQTVLGRFTDSCIR